MTQALIKEAREKAALLGTGKVTAIDLGELAGLLNRLADALAKAERP